MGKRLVCYVCRHTTTENRDTIGSHRDNYWLYQNCQIERKKEQVDRTTVGPDKRGKQKALFAKIECGSHNSTGCRDGVNDGWTVWKGHGQKGPSLQNLY